MTIDERIITVLESNLEDAKQLLEYARQSNIPELEQRCIRDIARYRRELEEERQLLFKGTDH